MPFEVADFKKSDVLRTAVAGAADDLHVIKSRTVGQRHADGSGPGWHDVAVGNDDPVRTDDEASTGGLGLLGLRESEAEEIGVSRCILAGHIDRDHALADVLSDRSD